MKSLLLLLLCQLGRQFDLHHFSHEVRSKKVSREEEPEKHKVEANYPEVAVFPS